MTEERESQENEAGKKEKMKNMTDRADSGQNFETVAKKLT